MTLNAEKGGEEWTVTARFAWKDLPAWSAPPRSEFGLRKRYLAFDFWDEKFLGVVEDAPFHALPKGSCQVISMRPILGRPQVLGTNRHLGQGAYELDNVKWSGSKLSGTFKRGSGQAWSLYVYVPTGWKVVHASAKNVQNGEVLKITFPVGSDPVGWSVDFARE